MEDTKSLSSFRETNFLRLKYTLQQGAKLLVEEFLPMRTSILIFLFLLEACTISLHGQSLRVTYLERSHTQKNAPKHVHNERMVLDICGQQSIFYSATKRELIHISDSLLRIGEDLNDHPNLVALFLNAEANPLQVLKHYPQKGIYTNSDYIMSNFYYEEPMPQIRWQIDNERKEVLGYECQKAVGKLFGRTWSVWFALELPLPEGPWLLQGLPGLIMEAEDEQQIFHLQAIGIEESTLTEVWPIDRGEKTKRKDFIRLRTEHDQDPSAALKRFLGYAEGDGHFTFRQIQPDGTYAEIDSYPPIHKHYYELE